MRPDPSLVAVSHPSRQPALKVKRPWLRWALLIYAVLLLASTLARQFVPEAGALRDGQERTALPMQTRDGPMAGTVEMAYEDLSPLSADPDAPVFVLIHGSPVASRALEDAALELRRLGRVIVPDLPGFGASTIAIPDYSTRAGARYTLALMNHLGLERAFFVGYSMAGGVLLNIAELAPERVEGLVMVAAIGVQEHELLGDYTLNRGLHGLQLAFLWLLQNGFPHFGYMDHSIINVAYARNFYDTDQRSFRQIIEAYEGPMLIQHGTEDSLVPPRAAAEHIRIAQQARLHWYNGGHIDFLTDPKKYINDIESFVLSVRSGTFAASEGADIPGLQDTGQGFIVLLLILGTQVAEDFTCIIAGVLASRDVLPFWAASLACAVGILLGDMLLYFLGLFLGPPALKRAPLRWMISEASVNRMARWYHRRGGMIILLARFVPGLRLPCYLGAGVLRIPLRRFLFFFIIAVLAWTPILVGVAYLLGDAILSLFERYEHYGLWLLLAFLLLMWIFLHWVVPLVTWRGRRQILGTWRRLARWEYWPIWALYIPVACFIVLLGLKHRCLSLFTAVNPGIANGGGLAMESKSAILTGLKDASESVASWVVLPVASEPEDNLESLRQFMVANGLSFPVVLKPDLGERGAGVAIINDLDAAMDYLSRCLDDTIAQAYISGLEFGVFYYRRPDEETGHILGITEKRFPFVTGDGRRTLERLILEDDRAVAMQRFFIKQFASRLEDIPADGERIPLTQLGTHCRGAIFLDGSNLATPELRMEIDRISKTFPGYDFGRYDVRVPSVEDFQSGKHIKVIELNGLSSEATYIYDPQHSYGFALKTLMQQWCLAFEIGRGNAARGHRPLSTWAVFKLYLKLLTYTRFEV